MPTPPHRSTPTKPARRLLGVPWRITKGLLWGILSLLVLWLLWVLSWYPKDPTLVKHILTYPYRRPITTTRWYKPREAIKGRFKTPLPQASPRKRAFLARAWRRTIAYTKRTNGYALLILHRGEIALERYWRGHTADAKSNSMSMAKSLVAMLTGAAIHDGAIRSVHQSAATYLPTWRRDRRRRIRIVDLLQMRSGLRGDGKRWKIGSDIAQLYFAHDILGHLLQIPAQQPPGVEFEYKDADSQALGAVLEAATKTRFARYLSQKLWQPIGANNGFVWLDHKGGSARTSCCVFATARDWARVGQLLLQRGRWKGKAVIPQAWIKAMTTPSPTEPDYGYQIWLGSPDGIRRNDRKEPFFAQDVIYLDGIFRQRVYVIPSHQLVVVRIGERWRRWDDAYLPNTAIEGLLMWRDHQTRRPTPSARR